MNKGIINIIILSIFCLTAFSQTKESFDPLLDSSCKVIDKIDKDAGTTSYLWYPGQLAAYRQSYHKEKSKERCVNVDYPGRFNPTSETTFFRTEVNLCQPTLLSWYSPGDVTFLLDGKIQETEKSQCVIPKGKHQLQLNVKTQHRLPSLLPYGISAAWEVSLDGKFWNIPESDQRYCNPQRYPDEDIESSINIYPISCHSYQEGRLYDFHHTEIGNIRLTIQGTGKLMFIVGESVEEALDTDTTHFEQYPLPMISLTGSPQEIVLPERALRFLYVKGTDVFDVKNIVLEAKVWPVEFQMQFDCDDSRFNEFWKVGVATLHTSMHNFYLDGIKRDYLPWAMDAIICQLAGDYVFGDRQVTRNGISISLMPPLPTKADWGIVDYPLHALLGLKQDYLRYGDLSTINMFRDRIEAQLELYESAQDRRGFIAASEPAFGFIPGWSRDNGPENFGIASYPQIMLYMNFRTAAYFYRLWKEPKKALYYEKIAVRLKDNIMKHFWDDEHKAFINGYDEHGEKDMRISHHAQYWAILADIYPAEYYNVLYDKIIPSIPQYKENVSYEKGYEVLTYVKANRTTDLFTLFDDVWGNWLRKGYHRFPENFSPKKTGREELAFYSRPYGLSLCHGANGAAACMAVLYGILGFSQSEEHPEEYTLRPNLLHLNKIYARIPVKEGYITVHIEINGHSTVDAPEGCIVHLIQ